MATQTPLARQRPATSRRRSQHLEQLTLPEFGRMVAAHVTDQPFAPYQAHSETSREAAEAVAPKAERLEARVLAFLKQRGREGGTDAEINAALHRDGESNTGLGPRRVGLCKKALVLDSGRTRPGPSGKRQTVWVAAEWAGEEQSG